MAPRGQTRSEMSFTIHINITRIVVGRCEIKTHTLLKYAARDKRKTLFLPFFWMLLTSNVDISLVSQPNLKNKKRKFAQKQGLSYQIDPKSLADFVREQDLLKHKSNQIPLTHSLSFFRSFFLSEFLSLYLSLSL